MAGLTDKAKESSVFNVHKEYPEDQKFIKLNPEDEIHQKVIEKITGIEKEGIEHIFNEGFYTLAINGDGICILGRKTGDSNKHKFHVTTTPDIILGRQSGQLIYLNETTAKKYGLETDNLEKIEGQYVCDIPPMDESLYFDITDKSDETKELLTGWVQEYQNNEGKVEVFSRQGDNFGTICMTAVNAEGVNIFEKYVFNNNKKTIYVNKAQVIKLGFVLDQNSGKLCETSKAITKEESSSLTSAKIDKALCPDKGKGKI